MRPDAETGTPRFRDMPTNVRRFVWLWFATYPVNILSVFLAPFDAADPVMSPFTRWVTVIVFLAGMLALDIWLCWKAAWRRKNWARWVLLAMFLVISPWIIAEPINIETLLGYLTTAMNALALFFAFTGNARPWFGAPDPEGRCERVRLNCHSLVFPPVNGGRKTETARIWQLSQ